MVTLVTFCGCATPYQKSGFGGGYSDTQLQDDVFSVRFRGNAYTSRATVQKYLLLRCAELTVENGYDYFIILERADTAKHSTYTAPARTTYQGTIQSSSYGRGMLPSYQTYGTATTYGGQTYHFSKPVSECVIKCFKGKKPENMLNAFDANQLRDYLLFGKRMVAHESEHGTATNESQEVSPGEEGEIKANVSQAEGGS